MSVARRETDPLHATPSTSALIVLELGVVGGVGVDVNVTVNAPSVTDFVPVAPVPATGARLNENVPVAPVELSAVSEIVPLPIPTPACQPAAGLPI